MYIFTTLEFPTHNIDFHLLTASVNAKYYYQLPVRRSNHWATRTHMTEQGYFSGSMCDI